MKLKIFLSILFSLLLIISKAQPEFLTKQQIKGDLESFQKILNDNSSYVYLNGYDFNKDVEFYLRNLNDSTETADFGLFLTQTVGKIGDRHSSVRGFEIKDSLYLPYIFAPLGKKIMVLKRNASKELEIFNNKFPYLKSIDGIPIEGFLQGILPKEISAPQRAYFTTAVREIRNIQKNYIIHNKLLPKNVSLIFLDSSSKIDTLLSVSPVERKGTFRPWDEKFESEYTLVKDEDYNKPEILDKLFEIKDQIAYIKIPAMVAKEDAPKLFEKVNSFMTSIHKNSKALIIDLRSNGGGTRDFIYEFAKYLVSPYSIFVVNITQQRGLNPLPKDYVESLHDRKLYSFSELDNEGQMVVKKFCTTFKPMYNLAPKKYSEYYYGLLNGRKLSMPSYYYNKPVYILANEKTFSSASVFVAAYKNIPNVKIVGVSTDGSSGNSENFDLPNSRIRIKLSTMVSFQKDGRVLDGYGTEPDIEFERDINQILWKSDTQLEKLKTLIHNSK